MHIQRGRMPRGRLLAGLPEAGTPGWTSYRRPGEAPAPEAMPAEPDAAELVLQAATASETGSVLFAGAEGHMLVMPPFPVVESVDYAELYSAHLLPLVQPSRTVAVFLLRRGGYTMGVFRGDALVDTKTDRRFVKNRHRKGGQSQRRFDRIREKQVYELFEMACDDARETLTPYEDEVQHVFLGGDRHTLMDFRKQCTYFTRFGERLMQRVLPVAGDPRRASLDALPREITSSDVLVLTPEPL